MTERCEEMLHPILPIAAQAKSACRGTEACAAALAKALAGRDKVTVAWECFPGVDQEEVLALAEGLGFDTVLHADDCALPPQKLDEALEQDLTQARVFGILTVRSLGDFFVPEKVAQARQAIQKGKRVLVYGVGATLLAPGDVLVYADITRWELQLRFRRGADNWRTARKNLPKLSKVKRGYFAEWRWGDKIKKACLPRMDFYLDTTTQGSPALVAGADYRSALVELAHRPFRMAPYYDPGVWGGAWMKNTFQLPENGSNYAWSFDGVPEENSLLLGFGPVVVETPAVNLVFSQPRALLGERVHARFGTEFPIRFDMLDTIHGQNLSLQVHPLTEYIQEAFNMRYTQTFILPEGAGDYRVESPQGAPIRVILARVRG